MRLPKTTRRVIMVYIRMTVLLGYPARLIRVAQRLIVGGLSVGLSRVRPYNTTESLDYILKKEIKANNLCISASL